MGANRTTFIVTVAEFPPASRTGTATPRGVKARPGAAGVTVVGAVVVVVVVIVVGAVVVVVVAAVVGAVMVAEGLRVDAVSCIGVDGRNRPPATKRARATTVARAALVLLLILAHPSWPRTKATSATANAARATNTSNPPNNATALPRRQCVTLTATRLVLSVACLEA